MLTARFLSTRTNSAEAIDLNADPSRCEYPRDPAVAADAMIANPKLCDEAKTIEDVRRLFLDSHVHAALVARDRRLITVIERGDLDAELPDNTPIAELGRLDGRVVAAHSSLAHVHRRMLRNRKRRLAVIDPDGHLLGLLCLKRTLAGFCSDQDVDARATSPGDQIPLS
jgi:predicted transcriptional regulator